MVCPFGRAVVIGSTPGPTTHLATVFPPNNGATYGFQVVEKTLNPINKVVDYSKGIIVLVDMSYQAGYLCGL